MAGLAGALVPLKFVLAQERADWMCLALRDAARLVGELRPCNTCGQEIAVFWKRKTRLYFTTATGRPHEHDCTELALQTVRETPEVLRALAVLKENGMLAVGLFGPEDD